MTLEICRKRDGEKTSLVFLPGDFIVVEAQQQIAEYLFHVIRTISSARTGEIVTAKINIPSFDPMNKPTIPFQGTAVGGSALDIMREILTILKLRRVAAVGLRDQHSALDRGYSEEVHSIDAEVLDVEACIAALERYVILDR